MQCFLFASKFGRRVIAGNGRRFLGACLLAQRRSGHLCPGILGHILAPVGVDGRAVPLQEVVIIAVHLARIDGQRAAAADEQAGNACIFQRMAQVKDQVAQMAVQGCGIGFVLDRKSVV